MVPRRLPLWRNGQSLLHRGTSSIDSREGDPNLGNAKPLVTVRPEGYIEATIDETASQDSSRAQPLFAEPIDVVVAQALAVERLRLEEATLADLNGLLERLQRSISVAQEAIRQMSDRQRIAARPPPSQK